MRSSHDQRVNVFLGGVYLTVITAFDFDKAFGGSVR